MKKVTLIVACTLTLFLAISSCKKEVLQNDNTSENATNSIDYSAIKMTSEKGSSMLVFESWEKFNEVKNNLAYRQMLMLQNI